MQRLMSIWLSLCLVILFLGTGCTKNEVPEVEAELPFVELNMYLIGDKPNDADLVYDELNKLIEVELNAHLNIHFISWEEREQKYPQILSSGVSVDLIYTSDWNFYDAEARKGTLKEITMDDITLYMPKTALAQPQATFEQAMIDGKMYMIPNYQEEFADYKLVLIRGDLREKYGMAPLKTFEDLETYYEKVIENETSIMPYGASLDNKEMTTMGFWQQHGFIRLNADIKASSFAIQYENGSSDYELFNILEIEDYLEYLREMRAWNLRGYWLNNAVANRTSAQTAFESGAAASLVWNIGTLNLSAISVEEKYPQWQPEIYDLSTTAPKVIAKYTNNGMGIAKQSLNYERSLMLLDKLKNDQRYWNLTWLGIEGYHWEAIGETQYGIMPNSERYPYAATSCWGWGNVPFQRVAMSTPIESQKLIEQWSEATAILKTSFFRFNDEKVRSEIAACTSVLNRYQPILELGMVADVEGTYNEMMDALDIAGWSAYEAEFRQQYIAFLETINDK